MKLKQKIQRELFLEKSLNKINRSYEQLAHKKELTKEQVDEIQEFYQGLFGYKVPTDWHRYFYSRTGVFSKKYLPTGIYRFELTGRLNQLPFCVPYSDKNMLDILLPEVKQPHIYLKNRNGYFFFENKPVSREEAVKLCSDLGDVIIKPALGSHGDGLKKVHIEGGIVDGNGTKLAEMLSSYGKDFLIQDIVVQHPEMSALNPDSINTIRFVTYRTGMTVYVVYSAIRIGRKGQVIDNESAGGMSAKINTDGTFSKYAFGAPGQDYLEFTDTGVRLEGYRVPCFDKAVEMVKTQHLNLPFQDLIGWDVCIDAEGDPVLLEWNTTPELSQSAVGPAFGDMTEQIVKDAMSRPNSRMGNTYRMIEPLHFNSVVKYYWHKLFRR